MFLSHSLEMRMLIKSNAFYFPLLRIPIPALATPRTCRNHCRPRSGLEQPLVSLGKGTWVRPLGFDRRGGGSQAHSVRGQFHLCLCLRVAAAAPVERPQLRKPPEATAHRAQPPSIPYYTTLPSSEKTNTISVFQLPGWSATTSSWHSQREGAVLPLDLCWGHLFPLLPWFRSWVADAGRGRTYLKVRGKEGCAVAGLACVGRRGAEVCCTQGGTSASETFIRQGQPVTFLM